MNLENFIRNKRISIDKYNWKLLNHKYTKEELKNHLADLILDHKIVLPLRDITEEECKKDFYNLMTNDYVKIEYGKTFSRYDYRYPLSDVYISSTIDGNDSSNYFQQYNRWFAEHNSEPSPIRTWKERSPLLSALGSIWSMKHEEVNSNVLRNCIALRKYIASQFKPNIAKFIYNTFNAKDVLDFSSGWGDRLSGFYSSNASSYYGIDPNTNVYKTYYKQIEFYEQFKHKKVYIENLPSEDVDLKDNEFDLVFTSPPYFCTEKYCDEETQSFKRYGDNIDKWLNLFLFKTIKNAWDHLKDNGYLIINIADVYNKSERHFICDPMNDFISTLDNASYLGSIGMKMQKRPNSLAVREDNTFVEPMWIWQKSKSPTSLDSIFKKDYFDLW